MGGYICSNCFVKISFSSSSFCLICNKHCVDGYTHPICRLRYVIDGCFVSLAYTGITRKLMYKYKFQPYLADLSGILGELFYEGIIQNESFYLVMDEKSIFVPIPLHRSKKAKRGYDQVTLLSKELSKKLGIRTVELIERNRRTNSQYTLTREERSKNLKDAFDVKKGIVPNASETIFLIDDVVTSGATFMSAAKTLKKAGYKKVYGLALAHGQ